MLLEKKLQSQNVEFITSLVSWFVSWQFYSSPCRTKSTANDIFVDHFTAWQMEQS